MPNDPFADVAALTSLGPIQYLDRLPPDQHLQDGSDAIAVVDPELRVHGLGGCASSTPG